MKGVRFSRRHLARLAGAGSFPAPLAIGGNSIAWVEGEIDEWVDERAALRESVDA
jgi:prophage regulatory protein